jgi:hypothetical protein
MAEVITEIAAKRVTKADTVARLKRLNWDAVQRAGAVFAEAVGNNEVTEADMDSLIRLTARLLEFIADAREIVHDESNSVSLVS